MAYDVLDYAVTPIGGGPVQITLPTDATIAARFVDPHDHSQTLADYTGAKAVRASALLGSLPAKRWKQILDFLVITLAAERAGIQEAPSDG
jgi:hypothetical protein